MAKPRNIKEINVWYFVYGTLLRGMPNHSMLAREARLVLPARLKGTIYHLPEGYPMLAEDDSGTVFGEAVLLPEGSPVLKALDRLEDYIGPGHPDNLYERVEREVDISGRDAKARARVYVCPPHRLGWVKKTGAPVPGGDWRRFIGSIAPGGPPG